MKKAIWESLASVEVASRTTQTFSHASHSPSFHQHMRVEPMCAGFCGCRQYRNECRAHRQRRRQREKPWTISLFSMTTEAEKDKWKRWQRQGHDSQTKEESKLVPQRRWYLQGLKKKLPWKDGGETLEEWGNKCCKVYLPLKAVPNCACLRDSKIAGHSFPHPRGGYTQLNSQAHYRPLVFSYILLCGILITSSRQEHCSRLHIGHSLVQQRI